MQQIFNPAAPTKQIQNRRPRSREPGCLYIWKIMTQEYVGAAAPVAPWLGGKSKLAKTVIARIDRVEHRSYIEPFVGMGGVFLRRAYRPKAEVVRDF